MQLLNWRLFPRIGTRAKILTFLAIAVMTLPNIGFIPGGASTVKAQVAGDSLYAVLYKGEAGTVYTNDLEFMFNTLINDFGYTKENIVVIAYDGRYYDFDGDFINDNDFAATRDNVDSVFTMLADIVTDGDVFFFFATNHGLDADSDCTDAALSIHEGDEIWEEDLAAYLDSLDTPTRTITKIVLLEPCFAGGMIPELSQLDYPIMIATAAKECEASHWDGDCDNYISCNHTAYAFHWTAAMHGSTPDGSQLTHADYNNDGQVSVQEAARFAKENDEFAQEDSSPKEHPLYRDSDCIVGQRTTLNGRLTSLPGFIAFLNPCHQPWSCRWCSWDCDGGPGSSPVRISGDSRSPQGVATTLWADRTPAPGETTYVYADVRNPGDTPLSLAEVKFYFSDPTLSLIYPQTGLNHIGTEIIPILAPHETRTVGPMPFVPPPEGNSFGEPYWTLMATAEHPASPVESGWLVDDDHVAAINRLEITGVPGEAKTIHLAARNALGVPVKALLSMDDDNLPTGWSAALNPAVGDTIVLGPDSWTPVELVLTGIAGPPHEGFVDVMMTLNTTSVKECVSCDDSICGGYIGEAGGFSVKLVVEGSVAVSVPEFAVSSTADAITLTWHSKLEGENVGFNVYRAEKEIGSFVRINNALIVGSGPLRYVDKSVVPGKTYLYVLGVVDGRSETHSTEKEAVLARLLEFSLSQNHPNPLNPVTRIEFGLDREGIVSLKIYDVRGRQVRTLVSRRMTPGMYSEEWDGRDGRGRRVASGIYFYRLTAGNRTLTKKMVLLK